ncbi:MAG: HAD hydrolase-like protein [Acetobacter sp.]|nr:HAD hydrolase-like protein [Acetobacter sp.]
MKYDTVIWDIDGTLINTAQGLVSAYQYSLDTLGLELRSIEEIKSFIGPVPKTVFIERFGMNEIAAQHASDIFRERYKTHDLLKAELYQGITTVLTTLKNNHIKQAVATNKRQDYALDICQHFGLDAFLNPILGPDNLGTQTKADLIIQCTQTLNAQHAVMIGDTKGDASAAQLAGIDFIGVNYGFGFKDIEQYANTPAEILNILGLK